jgi:hypothetical protein
VKATEKITNNTLHSRRPSRPLSNSSAAAVAASFELVVVTAAIAIGIAATAAVAVTIYAINVAIAATATATVAVAIAPLHCRCQHHAAGTVATLLADIAATALLPPPPHCRHRCRRRCTSTTAAKLKESCRHRCAAASLPATLLPIYHRHRQTAAATIAALPPRGASKQTERGREDDAAVGSGRLILTSLNYDSGRVSVSVI